MSNRKIKLGDYCDIIKGAIGIQKAIPGAYPLVVTAEKRLSHNEYHFDNTAVIIPLVSSTGHGHASLNRIHYQEGKFALGTILCAVIIKDKTILNPRYLYLYLSYFKDHLLVPLMKGAANVTLSIKKIKTVEIPLPKMERQLEIIELEKNSHLADKLKTEIQLQKNLLTQLKQSILQEAIQGKLTAAWRAEHPELTSGENSVKNLLKRIKAEKAQLVKEKKIKKEKPLPPITEDEIPFELPEGWVWCRLSQNINLVSGQDLAKHEYSDTNKDGFPYITGASNLKDGDVIINRWTKHPKSTAINGDLLLTCKGSGLGKMAFLKEEKVHIARQIMAIRSIEVNLEYIYLVLRTNVEFFKSKAKSLIPGIDRETVLKTVFPLPPLEEQKAIVGKVEAFMQQCSALEEEIATSEAHAQMLMQAVLKEAFEVKEEGKLEPAL